MPEFIITPRTITGEQYAPGLPCPGVLALLNGTAAVLTRHGLQLVAPGACVYPDPGAPGYFLSKAVDEIENPQARALKDQMTVVFSALPLELRAAFRPTKTAVLDAINDNCFDEAHFLINAAEVPAEYAEAKAALLALLS